MDDTLSTVACPDCGGGVTPAFTLLTDNNRLVTLGTCRRCNDHVSVRAFATLPTVDYLDAAASGLLIVSYAKRRP